jgi:uncharacterized protein (DUF342 family)
MRKIVNRKAVPVDLDDPPPGFEPEGSAESEDALKMSEFEAAATRPNSDAPLDYVKLGEHVASVVRAAEIASERMREEAKREVAASLSETERARLEAEGAVAMMRERAAAEAEETRVKAEAEAAKVIAAAKRIETREEKAAQERLANLQQHVELTEKRLNQLVGGLRQVAVQLEDLAEAEGLPARSDEDQTKKEEETLDESLRASIGT